MIIVINSKSNGNGNSNGSNNDTSNINKSMRWKRSLQIRVLSLFLLRLFCCVWVATVAAVLYCGTCKLNE